MRIERQDLRQSPFCATIAVPIQQDKHILDTFLCTALDTLSQDYELTLIIDGLQPAVEQTIMARVDQFAGKGIGLTVASSERPQGWERCINWALGQRRGRHFATADSDIIFSDSWADQLFAHFERDNHIGAVGAMLLYPQTGGIQHCGITFTEDTARHVYLNARPDVVPAAPFSVQCVIGALFAISDSALKSAGEFDEGYFNSYSDFDYCMKLRSAGFSILVDPGVTAYHWERSNGLHRQFSRRTNLARFWRRWGNAIQADSWDFLERRFRPYLDHFGSTLFQPVDIAAARVDAATVWKRLNLWGCAMRPLIDCSADISDSGDIWLPQVLGSDGHRNSRPYLFLVDNFVRLLGNRYWSQLRAGVSTLDIVVDLYGNVIDFHALQIQSWPGQKIR